MGNHKIITARGSQTVRYSMYDFIEYVRCQSLIWDRFHEAFRNRERREDAWHEVARKLYPNFDNISDAEKQNIVQTLTKRWKNTRDSYFRGFRHNSSNQGNTHCYIYQNELSFLRECGNESQVKPVKSKTVVTKLASKRKARSVKIASRRHRTQVKTRRSSVSPTTSPVSEFERVCSEIEEHLQNDEQDEAEPGDISAKCNEVPKIDLTTSQVSLTSIPTKQETQIKSKIEETVSMQSAPQSSMQVTQTQPAEATQMCVDSTTDSDQAFFDSIKPVIRKMTVDQKIDFQIEILKLLKNFRSS